MILDTGWGGVGSLQYPGGSCLVKTRERWLPSEGVSQGGLARIKNNLNTFRTGAPVPSQQANWPALNSCTLEVACNSFWPEGPES